MKSVKTECRLYGACVIFTKISIFFFPRSNLETSRAYQMNVRFFAISTKFRQVLRHSDYGHCDIKGLTD